MLKFLTRSLAAAAVFACTQAGAATVIDYANFNDASGLQLNGNATTINGALRVTPAAVRQSGSVFSTNRISLAGGTSFSSYFQFRFTNPGGTDGSGQHGADGMVFTVGTRADSLGAPGYSGIGNSVGIEFDTYINPATDFDPITQSNSSNHVGYNVDGSLASRAIASVDGDMNDGQTWNAWIDYDGFTHEMEVRLTQSTIRPTEALLSYTRDITLDLGTTNAYFGFAAATGGGFANHDVLRWTVDTTPAPVPEPGSLALAGLALAGMGVVRRRQPRG